MIPTVDEVLGRIGRADEPSFNVVLVTPGGLIEGEVISTVAFLEERLALRARGSGVRTPPDVADNFRELEATYRMASEEGYRPAELHLRDATVRMGALMVRLPLLAVDAEKIVAILPDASAGHP